MRRIVIVGNSGSGKTTLGDSLAAAAGLGRIELDAWFHGPGWTPTPAAEFAAAVRSALDAADADFDGWVVCGNYLATRDVLWPRADTIVWLDYPRHIVMGRVTRRSLQRVITGEQLWNGNQESWGKMLALHDPERSVIRWSWDGVTGYRDRLRPIWSDPQWGPKRWIHLRHPRDTARWLRVVTAGRVVDTGGGSTA